MRRIVIVFCFFGLVLSGCKNEPQPEPVDEAVSSAAPSRLSTGSAVPVEPETAYLTAVTGLRREPSDAKKVAHPETGKELHNWMTTLYRGEEVNVLEVEGE